MLMLLEDCVSFFGVFFGGVAERRSRGGDFLGGKKNLWKAKQVPEAWF
jgi:hypothetical protein